MIPGGESAVFAGRGVLPSPGVLEPTVHVCLRELSASDWQGSGCLLLSAPSAARGKVALLYGVSLMFAASQCIGWFWREKLVAAAAYHLQSPC